MLRKGTAMARNREDQAAADPYFELYKYGADPDLIKKLDGSRELARYVSCYRHIAKIVKKAQLERVANRLLEYDSDATEKKKPISVHHLTGKRLSDAINNAGIDISMADLLLLMAPKANGKTHFYSQTIKSIPDDQRVVALVHRRSLARALANRLGLDCYLDDTEFKDRYVISVDSLIKLDLNREKPYDILLIDEVEQVLRHAILSDTTEKYRGAIFRALCWLINGAKQIICADADLTGELTCHLLAKLRRSFEQDRITMIFNQWPANRSINVYESKQHLIADLMVAVSEGKRIYVPVGELALANSLKALMDFSRNPDGSPVTALVLTGETSEDEQSKAFFNNPNAEASKYQVLIANSVLSTGVSIEDKFDAVYGIFDPSVYTYQDCDQAISRARYCDEVKVWIHDGPKQVFQSEADIRSGPVRKELLTRSYAIPDHNGKLSEGDELYMDIEARVRWCEQQWKSNRKEQFIDLKRSEGWTVIKIRKDKAMHEAGVEFLKIGKDPTGDKFIVSIAEAEDIDGFEFEELKGQSPRGAKARAIKKFVIAEFFELPSPADVTPNLVRAYYEKNMRETVKNAKLLKDSRLDAIERDRIERENPKNLKAFTSFNHNTAMRDILSAIQDVTGIEQGRILRLAKCHVKNEKRFAAVIEQHHPNSRECRAARKRRKQRQKRLESIVSIEQIDKLAQYVEANLDHLNLFLGTNFKTPTALEAKTKVFNTVMGQLGIEIKKRPFKRKGQKGHEYFIDYDRVAEFVAAKDLRQIVDV